LRKGGELVLIGVPWKRRADLQAYDLLHVIFHRYIHLRGGWEWELPRQRGDFDRASIWSNIQGALDWLDQKRLNVDGIYDVCRPDQCQQAYDRLIKQGDGPLTTVFDWTH
jgi:threonine dehydrogenase-like Zn-dependent dehydrogenase